MVNNQLFRKHLPRNIALKVINAFGLTDFEDNHNFSRKDLININCLDKIAELVPVLKEYYLPCKARTYLSQLNVKNIITILRQVSKLYGYSVISREKYSRGDKFMIYQLVPSDTRHYQPVVFNKSESGKEEYTVDFA